MPFFIYFNLTLTFYFIILLKRKKLKKVKNKKKVKQKLKKFEKKIKIFFVVNLFLPLFTLYVRKYGNGKMT